MRILFLSKGFASHEHRFLQALSNTPHEIHFLQLSKKNENGLKLPPNVIETIWPADVCPDIKIPENLLENLQKIINKISPDVIHAGPLHSVALAVAMLQYQPLVSMSWGYDLLLDADKNDEYRQATKTVLAASKVLICDCKTSREKAMSFGFSEQQVVTFPWGVDLKHFSPDVSQNLRAQLNWQDNFLLLSTRSWEPMYGVDVVAKAFVKIAQNNPNARLVLLGAGSQKDLLQNIFATNEVLNKVHFAGQVSLHDLPKYYCAADLYISASYVDGSSVSLMEAMACGLPVLVSDIPGNKEWVADGKHGWLFKSGDAADLADKVGMVINNDHHLPLIGNKVRIIAEQRADWNKNSQFLLSAYNQALLS